MISKEEIHNVAELARLKLTGQEASALQKDISNILDYVGQVAAVSGSAQKEVGENHNVMREDTPRVAEDTLAGKEEALRGAFPKREGDFNVVRKIIQKDE